MFAKTTTLALALAACVAVAGCSGRDDKTASAAQTSFAPATQPAATMGGAITTAQGGVSVPVPVPPSLGGPVTSGAPVGETAAVSPPATPSGSLAVSPPAALSAGGPGTGVAASATTTAPAASGAPPR
jgi:hypothetical protein